MNRSLKVEQATYNEQGILISLKGTYNRIRNPDDSSRFSSKTLESFEERFYDVEKHYE